MQASMTRDFHKVYYVLNRITQRTNSAAALILDTLRFKLSGDMPQLAHTSQVRQPMDETLHSDGQTFIEKPRQIYLSIYYVSTQLEIFISLLQISTSKKHIQQSTSVFGDTQLHTSIHLLHLNRKLCIFRTIEITLFTLQCFHYGIVLLKLQL